MRLAGTWSMYSKIAIPQLMSVAINQGLLLSSFRWAYHAKVRNTLLSMNSPMEMTRGCCHMLSSYAAMSLRWRTDDQSPAKINTKPISPVMTSGTCINKLVNMMTARAPTA